MKVGFVNIFGKPNAGKSTLLNALIGEKMAIVSHKVQTTRHRIKAFLNKEWEYQIIFSDTPGIIEPKYKLHEKMMKAVKSSLEDADVALLLVDINDSWEEADAIFSSLKLKVPSIVITTKTDLAKGDKEEQAKNFFSGKSYCKEWIGISVTAGKNVDKLLELILTYLKEGQPFYDEEDLTDLPTKFFVGEMVREKIFELFGDEIPYHTTVVVNEFKEKTSLIKIQADIIVQRESQKAIILGEGGKMIKQVGSLARKDIEEFLGQKVFLELFVKVKNRWRDDEMKLREYGYTS
ncbi:GTPase Era [Segetibacter koreensis]|uniref:GTPase Era n=1 Tax=Segetibacter koreensis TaxID=398037 RepID=UPI00036129CA|nr:GTPase Era [Segetibacter koreensis]